jgi:hypothetical protein
MPAWLPGRALFYVAPLVGLIATAVNGWALGLVFGAGYLLWGVPAWGRWYDLGRMEAPQDRPDPFERGIEAISFGRDHVALFWRHMFGVAPMTCGLAYLTGDLSALLLAPLFASATVVAYDLAWCLWPRSPVIYAEYMNGAMWGFMITSN